MTARAVKRMFEFVPRREVVRVFGYLFAIAARRYGMQVHEALCMSNHFHLLLTDVDGQLPKFMAYFDSLLARSLNAMRGTSGTVLEKGYNIVVVTDESAVLEHAVYVLANPCAAHLVRRSKQWPGFSTLGMRYGQAAVFERPNVGLWKRAAGPKRRHPRNPEREQHHGKPSRLPEVATLTLIRPSVAQALTDTELRADILRRLDARELELIAQRRARGTDVLGVRRVLEQSCRSCPARPEELFGTEPGVSGKNKWARIEALQRRRDFEEAYARARAEFVAGFRAVVWPMGTWLMRVRFGLPCDVAPP